MTNTTATLIEPKVLKDDSEKFIIAGQMVVIYSEDLLTNRSTIAEVNGQLHYMGDELSNFSTAIFAFQEVMGRDLTNEELHQALIDNRVESQGV